MKPHANRPCDELDAYLASDIEDISDALKWWHEHRATYLRLSHMALDYLTIPGTSSYFLIYSSSNLLYSYKY